MNENRRRTYKEITGIINENRNLIFLIKNIEGQIRKLGYVGKVAKKKAAVRVVNKKERKMVITQFHDELRMKGI